MTFKNIQEMHKDICKYIFFVIICFFTNNANSTIASDLDANAQTVHSFVLRNGWLYMISTDGDVISRERISDIRSIVFLNNHSEETDIIEVLEDNIRIYPNPVQEALIIESADETTYKVFDIDGKCLMNGKGKTICVSSLIKGTYLLKINNNTFKFIKQ